MADALPLLRVTQASCTCPVCLDVFKDPVGFHCGHVLCRSCALRCVAARPRCPLCNQAVPNARHLLPLPQLSLFCTLSREVGLRAQSHLQPPLSVSPSKVGEQSDLGHPGRDFGGVKRGHSEDAAPQQVQVDNEKREGEVRQEQPQLQRQRIRREASPPPSFHVTTDHLPELLLRNNTTSDTQRLQSESPEVPLTPFAAPATSSRSLETTTVLATTVAGHHRPQIERCSRSQEQASASGSEQKNDITAADVRSAWIPTGAAVTAVAETPSTSATSSVKSPVSPTLAFLRARFAEEAEQLESTPRLDAAVLGADNEHRSGDEADDARRPREADLSEPSSASSTVPAWWRLWKRGLGVVRCTLIPPAVRLEAAREEKQVKQAVEFSSDGNATNVEAEDAGRDEQTRRRAPSLSTLLTSGEETRVHRAGRCVLCGLDVVHRPSVRHYLQRLLHSSFARCDAAELAAQTEDGLSLLLGPLWGVHCVVDPRAPSSGSSSVLSTSVPRVGVYTSSENSHDLRAWISRDREDRLTSSVANTAAAETASHHHPSLTTLHAVVHHNCLAWSGLLDVYTDTSAEADTATAATMPTTTMLLRLTVPLCDPFELAASHASGRVARWQLLAATLWHLHHTPKTAEEIGAAEVRSCRATPHCALCATSASASASSAQGDLFGVGLRACEGTERGESSCGRQYHYLCSLLAGASACLVFGLEDARNVLASAGAACHCDGAHAEGGQHGRPVEVWCGLCHNRHESRQRSRQT